jgi:hypothetical protein
MTSGPEAATGAGPVRFRLLTPDNWYVLDLDPVTRNGSIGRLVERRFGRTDDPRLVQARRDLTALLRGAARDAADNGAVYAALMDLLVADDTGEQVALSASLIAVVAPAPTDPDGNVLTDPAALAVAMIAGELADVLSDADDARSAAEAGAPRPPGVDDARSAAEASAPRPPGVDDARSAAEAGAPRPPGVDDAGAAPEACAPGSPNDALSVAGALVPEPRSAGADGAPVTGGQTYAGGGARSADADGRSVAGGRASGAADVAASDVDGRPAVVELPTGPAVRLSRIGGSGPIGAAGGDVPSVQVQYFLPVPDSEQILILTFGTPNRNLRAEFEELFGQIAGSLSWEWDG